MSPEISARDQIPRGVHALRDVLISVHVLPEAMDEADDPAWLGAVALWIAVVGVPDAPDELEAVGGADVEGLGLAHGRGRRIHPGGSGTTDAMADGPGPFQARPRPGPARPRPRSGPAQAPLRPRPRDVAQHACGPTL